MYNKDSEGREYKTISIMGLELAGIQTDYQWARGNVDARKTNIGGKVIPISSH